MKYYVVYNDLEGPIAVFKSLKKARKYSEKHDLPSKVKRVESRASHEITIEVTEEQYDKFLRKLDE